MIIAYLDETGDPVYRRGGPKWFGITAAIFHDSKLLDGINVMKSFNQSKSEEYDCDFEIHAREFSSSKKEPYNAMKVEEKIELFTECLHTVKNTGASICGVFVDKVKHSYWHGKYDFLKNVVMNLFERIGRYQIANYPNEAILILYDQPSAHLRPIIKQYFKERLEVGSRYVKPAFFLKEILYVESKFHQPIQIADLTGYIVRRLIEKRIDGTFSSFLKYVDDLYKIIRPMLDFNPTTKEIYGAGIKIIESNDRKYYGRF
ncbi:hypothetical protein NEF87_002683 [Candidatus Lokiarchaeum ossiferum]|uniref:DUF3800 domain-containing protein n=1 Tax=Candidatus Lokiarchaeum ossiferum TaxID=2951803 RepID=A0ABY6HSR6_9ARCH|nr:hypothetical protein NEF87_002683 [Candidatus Lokiarchaeum sp. B-35]